MLPAFAALAAVLSVAGAGAGGAAAELLSSRPITIVIPFTPGASSDTLQRIVDKKVSENTGQTLVVESRPGGSGVIAAAVVKQATADGHTLLQANAATHASNTSLYATLPYNPIKDFRPITLLWSFPQLLAVPPDSTAKSVSDLVALAKSKPGGLSFASQGTGSGGHLLGEMFKLRTAANMVHIPYRGAAPAAIDLAAGRVDFFFVSVVCAGRQGARHRRHFTETSAGAAGYSDDDGGRLRRTSARRLVRPRCAGGHARRRDRQAQRCIRAGGAR